MVRILSFFIVLALGALVAGAVYLGSRDMPPPKRIVEKIIPNDQFPR